MGGRAVSGSFACPFYWVGSSSLDVRMGAWSYCNFLCHVWEACYFLKGNKGKVGLGERGSRWD